MARRTIDDLPAQARQDLKRLTALEAPAALDAGAVLVDTCSDDQRRTPGLRRGLEGPVPTRSAGG